MNKKNDGINCIYYTPNGQINDEFVDKARIRCLTTRKRENERKIVGVESRAALARPRGPPFALVVVIGLTNRERGEEGERRRMVAAQAFLPRTHSFIMHTQIRVGDIVARCKKRKELKDVCSVCINAEAVRVTVPNY